MISPEASTLLTVIFYALSCMTGFLGMLVRNRPLRRLGCGLAVGGFAAQTTVLSMGFHALMPEGLSLGAYLQLLGWFVMLCGLVLGLRLRRQDTVLFVAPFSLMLFLMSASWLDVVVHLPDTLKLSFYALHIGALFLSLALIVLAFAAGALFLALETRIKTKQLMRGLWRDMPALSLLDAINAFCVLVAFPLYTIGIVAGLAWSKPVFGHTVTGDPKTIVSMLIWLFLAVLFHNRIANGWQGKKPARLSVFIFLLCLFSLFVVNFFMETQHAFLRG